MDQTEYLNLSQILANGFVETYVRSDHPDREKAKAELRNTFQRGYGLGFAAGQEQFAQRLMKLIHGREQVEISELLALVSKL